MNCSIGWIEIPAPDLEGACAFYSGIFGWAIEDYSPAYKVFRSANMSGGLNQHGRPTDDGIRVSITVESIDATLERIAREGGAIVRSKHEIPGGFGFTAMFKDPNGNVLELWAES